MPQPGPALPAPGWGCGCKSIPVIRQTTVRERRGWDGAAAHSPSDHLHRALWAPQLTPFFPCLRPLDQAVAKPDGSSPGAKTKEPLRDAVVTLPHHHPQSSFCPG